MYIFVPFWKEPASCTFRRGMTTFCAEWLKCWVSSWRTGKLDFITASCVHCRVSLHDMRGSSFNVQYASLYIAFLCSVPSTCYNTIGCMSICHWHGTSQAHKPRIRTLVTSQFDSSTVPAWSSVTRQARSHGNIMKLRLHHKTHLIHSSWQCPRTHMSRQMHKLSTAWSALRKSSIKNSNRSKARAKS